jgi:hypothetical protein
VAASLLAVAAHDRVASVGRGTLVAIRGAHVEDIVDIHGGSGGSRGRDSEGQDGEEVGELHFGLFYWLVLVSVAAVCFALLCFALLGCWGRFWVLGVGGDEIYINFLCP